MFPGSPAEWTADQRRLVSITKQYTNVFQALAMREHDPPKDEILHNYGRFREWWEVYSEHPEAADNPYRRYQFSTRK